MTRLAALLLFLSSGSIALAEKSVDEHLSELRERYEALDDFYAYYRAINAEKTVVEIVMADVRSSGALGVRMTQEGQTFGAWIDGEEVDERSQFIGSVEEPALVQGGVELLDVFNNLHSLFDDPGRGDPEEPGRHRASNPYISLELEELGIGIAGNSTAVGGIVLSNAARDRVGLIEVGDATVKFSFGADEWMNFDRATGLLVEHVMETPEGRRRVWLEDYFPGKDIDDFREHFPLPKRDKLKRLPIGATPNIGKFHAMVFNSLLKDAKDHGAKAAEIEERMAAEWSWPREYWRVLLVHSFPPGFWEGMVLQIRDKLHEEFEKSSPGQPEGAFATWLEAKLPEAKKLALAEDDWRERTPWVERVEAALAPSLEKLPSEEKELGRAVAEAMLRRNFEAFIDLCYALFDEPAE